MTNLVYVAQFIEAKSASRKAFNEMVLRKADSAEIALSADDTEFVKSDHVVHVIEFFILLMAYGVNEGPKVRQFAMLKNENIEQRIEEIRATDCPAGVKAALVSDLQKGLFSTQALDRLEWIMDTHQGIEQAALSRFLAAYMSDTWLKRCLGLLLKIGLLDVVKNQLGGKVYLPADDLFSLYEETVSHFTTIWEREPT